MRPKPNATPDDVAFGINAVAMAVRNGHARALLYAEQARNPRLLTVVEAAAAGGIPVQPVDAGRLDQLSGGGVHQGLLARLRPLPTVDLRRVADERTGPSLVVLVDGVTDPQNLGSVLRTAVATGCDAIVLPRRRGVQLTPGVHRASAGLSFVAPVAAPANLAAAVRELKDLGYWVVASDMEGAADATSFDWPRRTALVMGSEEQGVSRLLRDLADFTVALPMAGGVESLNVGVAFGALAYLWRRRWPAGPTTGDATSTS